MMHEVGWRWRPMRWSSPGGTRTPNQYCSTDGAADQDATGPALPPSLDPDWVELSDSPRAEWRVADGEAAGGELTTSIPAGNGVVTITGRFDRIGIAARVRAREAAMRLRPLVQPLLRLWAARLKPLSRVRGLTAASNRNDVGIVLVNRHGHLLFANATAEALIAQGDGVRRQGPMLSGTRLADTLRLQATIEHVITNGEDSGRDAPAPVIALSRRTRRPLLAAVVGGEPSLGRAEESAAIVYLCDPDQDLTRLIEPACKLYGLSPVETRMTCLLSGGVSLAEAAETMRVREQTARSHLKQIFLKTDTNRHAELVWLMLKSSVRTTPRATDGARRPRSGGPVSAETGGFKSLNPRRISSALTVHTAPVPRTVPHPTARPIPAPRYAGRGRGAHNY